jgi:ABC-type transport system substrate-binding protein
MEILQAGLKTLNIELEIQTRDFAPVVAQFRDWKKQNDNNAKREIQGHMLGLGAFMADSWNFLSIYLCNDDLNYMAYCNPAVDAKIRKAGATLDEKERTKLYREAVEQIYLDAPDLYVGLSRQVAVVKKDLTRFELDTIWHPHGVNLAALGR